MDERYFNTLMPKVNHKWSAKVLGMQVNQNEGPDLISENKLVEVKFGLTPGNWTILEHQMSYQSENPDKPIFWLFGLYSLNRPIKKIRTESPALLEQMVIKREAYLVQWDWMHKFSKSKGKHNTYRYPDYSLLPEITEKYNVEKGIICITHNVQTDLFKIKGTRFGAIPYNAL